MQIGENCVKKYISIIICTVIAIAWVGFIWSNSAKTGEESGEASSQVHEVVNDVAQSVGVEEPISERTVRKSAHFGEYMILGLIVCIDMIFISKVFLSRSVKMRSLSLLAALPFSAAIAMIDEFVIQKNTDGRGPSFTDVLIDMSGVSLGVICILVGFLVAVYIAYRRKKVHN